MASFGFAFSRDDIENRIGSKLNDKQLEVLVFELQDAFSYYFESDLRDQLKAEIESGTIAGFAIGNLKEDSVEISDSTVGKFIYDKPAVQEILELEISDDHFARIVGYFNLAFARYFDEECERLWQDIDTIVEEFESEE